jgi:predicted nuclease with TOPRIM domain
VTSIGFAKKLPERAARSIVPSTKGTDHVNTSQYDAETRKQMRRDQRTPAYRELQRRAAEDRARLEEKLRERNAAIARLTKKLVEAGFPTEEVEKLAA